MPVKSWRGPRALLRAQFEARRPESDRLIIEAVADGPAENVELELDDHWRGAGTGDGWLFPSIERLLPRTGYPLLIAVTIGSAAQWRVQMRWEEAGVTFEETQSVSSF